MSSLLLQDPYHTETERGLPRREFCHRFASNTFDRSHFAYPMLICLSFRSINYTYMYTYKCNDRLTELTQFLRYLSCELYLSRAIRTPHFFLTGVNGNHHVGPVPCWISHAVHARPGCAVKWHDRSGMYGAIIWRKQSGSIVASTIMDFAKSFIN